VGRLVPVSAKVEPELAEALRAYARKRNMAVSEVIRRAVAWYLNVGPGQERQPKLLKFKG